MNVTQILGVVVAALFFSLMAFNLLKNPLRELENFDTIALRLTLVQENTILEMTLNPDSELKQDYLDVLTLLTKNRPERAVSYLTEELTIADLKSIKSAITETGYKQTADALQTISAACTNWLTFSTGRQSFPTGETESSQDAILTMENFFYTQLREADVGLLRPSSTSITIKANYDSLEPLIVGEGVNINLCIDCSDLIKKYEAARLLNSVALMGIIEGQIIEKGCASACLKVCGEVYNSIKPLNNFDIRLAETAKTFIFTSISLS